MAITKFEVLGPYEIPQQKGKGGKAFTKDKGKEFWASREALGSKLGVYVFAFKAARGFTPWYVGMSTKGFKKETFASHKLEKYNEARTFRKTKTPVMFFLVYPTHAGPVALARIDELETFLISTGKAINPDLLNKQKTKEPKWSIAGVVRAGAGQPTTPQAALKRLFNWTKR